jgi:hypothetical protein
MCAVLSGTPCAIRVLGGPHNEVPRAAESGLGLSHPPRTGRGHFVSRLCVAFGAQVMRSRKATYRKSDLKHSAKGFVGRAASAPCCKLRHGAYQ